MRTVPLEKATTAATRTSRTDKMTAAVRRRMAIAKEVTLSRRKTRRLRAKL
jgi:hypothetical protein